MGDVLSSGVCRQKRAWISPNDDSSDTTAARLKRKALQAPSVHSISQSLETKESIDSRSVMEREETAPLDPRMGMDANGNAIVITANHSVLIVTSFVTLTLVEQADNECLNS